MTDRIDLIGLEIRARHGVLAHEQTTDQLFLVDISVFLDTSPASVTDDLADTVDYGALAQRAHDVGTGASYQLIETLADRVAREVLGDTRVERVVVTVHKPEAPIPAAFEDVSVTIDRSR